MGAQPDRHGPSPRREDRHAFLRGPLHRHGCGRDGDHRQPRQVVSGCWAGGSIAFRRPDVARPETASNHRRPCDDLRRCHHHGWRYRRGRSEYDWRERVSDPQHSGKLTGDLRGPPAQSVEQTHAPGGFSDLGAKPIASNERRREWDAAQRTLVHLSCNQRTSLLFFEGTFSVKLLPSGGVVRGSIHFLISLCPSAKEKPPALL